MSRDAGLELLLDADRLSDVVGAPVRAVRLRPKPGVASAAALVTRPQGQPAGWVRTLTGEARVKAEKVRLHAEEAGRAHLLGQARLDGDTLVLWGPVGADPRLVRDLGRLHLTDDATVLRHNPLRRVVIRDGDVVHRVTAAPHRRRLTATTTALAAAGVPVVTPLEGGLASRRVTTWPWVEGTDATADTTPAVRREIGRVLARLHAVAPDAVPDLPMRRGSDVVASARASAALLRSVGLTGPADRAAALLDLAEPQLDADDDAPLVVSHGDFSLDQCLVTANGDIRLTDFDRAALAPVDLDLAGLVAACLAAGLDGCDDVLAGHAPGRRPRPAWVAAALLARLAEPWRMQAPDWEAATGRLLVLAADQLGALAPATLVPAEVATPDARVVVSRAWPASDGTARVTVEGVDDAGRLRAGTWDPDSGAELLAPGRDRRLPALAPLAERGRLRVHRAGRRAVVELPAGFAKVLRPGRAHAVAAATESGRRLAEAAGLRAAAVLEADGQVVLTSRVPGVEAHALADDASWPALWLAWAGAWTRFQAQGAPPGLAAHTHTDEAAVLRTWAERSGPFLLGTGWPDRLAAVAGRLEATASVTLVPTHRDLHDKQLLWDGQALGVLDLDTVCLAEPALDPANLAVHAELRHAQGIWTGAATDEVTRRAREVADAAGVDDDRWELARAATVARLVAVYATRPRWRDVVLRWADAAW